MKSIQKPGDFSDIGMMRKCCFCQCTDLQHMLYCMALRSSSLHLSVPQESHHCSNLRVILHLQRVVRTVSISIFQNHQTLGLQNFGINCAPPVPLRRNLSSPISTPQKAIEIVTEHCIFCSLVYDASRHQVAM